MPQIEEMIDVNLDSPNTPEDHHQHSPAFKKCITFNKNVDNIQYEGQDTTDFVTSPQKLRSWSTLTDKDDDKPHLRYFSVGPSTHQLRCPLCKQRADAETVQMSGILGQLSCLLSSFSCCFPIFSLSLVYMCLQSRLKSKRLFCNNCGGHLGFYWRPT
ncbi:uncharacterized protein LOC119614389 [Lucilia sericata]|uniref:uncharacterized protein LOC119614389 n=1 Tax=Lucilia sericata TaxID=13632 RepID=UPI0018A859E3|nr:uncharacterized protein LOC119614389 [Lucilia sericata]